MTTASNKDQTGQSGTPSDTNSQVPTADNRNYTYRLVIRPWYPSFWVERADMSSIEYDSVKWETVMNGASTPEVVKRMVLAEIDKMFDQGTGRSE